MNGPEPWYRSASGAVSIPPSRLRAIRNRLRSWLPEPRVRGRIIVLESRRTFPAFRAGGFRSEFQGLFSEFHSVLGALAYASAHGAAGVRVDFRSPLYVDAGSGANWWSAFFERDTMLLDPAASGVTSEVRLDGLVTKYGRFGGFSDVVQGETAYLYPMTYGLDRDALHRLIDAHIAVRQWIRDETANLIAASFEPDAFVVGVHYRGTDATHKRTGWLTHYRTAPVPYRMYADEVRRVLEMEAPRAFQVFVATDEIECLEFMRREFGDRVIHVEQAPRARAEGQAVHLDRTLPVSNDQKGRSAIVDCLMLAACSYLVKGRSNLSDASLAFNPRLPYSFYPDVQASARIPGRRGSASA
jgi:hypothetical protein